MITIAILVQIVIGVLVGILTAVILNFRDEWQKENLNKKIEDETIKRAMK